MEKKPFNGRSFVSGLAVMKMLSRRIRPVRTSAVKNRTSCPRCRSFSSFRGNACCLYVLF
jgi:hypothetical protein